MQPLKESYRTVYKGGTAELTEKKSRFIASVFPVRSEEEALALIEDLRKKYWDARHNCYAYTVGSNREHTRASDDGEPAQTAGKPMLDVILGMDLYDTLVVVTRYFGGILLGTGGLVRAYSGAAALGLKESVVIEKTAGVIMRVDTDYNDYGRLEYLIRQKDFPVLNTEFTQNVRLDLAVPASGQEPVVRDITEATDGRAKIRKEKEVWFARNGKEVLTFSS